MAERLDDAAGFAELAPALSLPDIDMPTLAAKLSKRGMRALPEYTAALRREVIHGA